MLKKILFIMLFMCISVPVGAVELLMFNSNQCGFCKNFLKEVEPTYSQTKYGKVMPLNIININEDPPKWVKTALDKGILSPIRATPTFVLWDNVELARTEGYRSKEHFYMIMDAFLEDYMEKKTTYSPSVPKQKGPLVPFFVPDLGTPSDRHNRQFIPGPPPKGVIDSRDLYQHMYQTAEEALKGAQWLGCGNNVHFHEEENVWMPCMMEM